MPQKRSCFESKSFFSIFFSEDFVNLFRLGFELRSRNVVSCQVYLKSSKIFRIFGS